MVVALMLEMLQSRLSASESDQRLMSCTETFDSKDTQAGACLAAWHWRQAIAIRLQLICEEMVMRLRLDFLERGTVFSAGVKSSGVIQPLVCFGEEVIRGVMAMSWLGELSNGLRYLAHLLHWFAVSNQFTFEKPLQR